MQTYYLKDQVCDQLKHLIDLSPSTHYQDLAKKILAISNHFQHQSAAITPWNSQMLAAYMAYFVPLNILRYLYVLDEAKRLGFAPLCHRITEIGCGPGTFHFALMQNHTFTIEEYFAVDASPQIIEYHKKLCREVIKPIYPIHHLPSATAVTGSDTALFTYSLNEFTSTPPWLNDFHNLIIIEPSTREQGRRLLELRARLIKSGYHLWAPCVHQENCPLLTHSPRDWCHQRIHVQLPSWFDQLEAHLPMRNETLTFCYLLASKTPPPLNSSPRARLIGDTLYEKGKVRQALCRGPKREFLSWLTKTGPGENLPHGALIEMPKQYDEVSNEIRPKEKIKIC